jgi:hypothetical protein
VKVGVWYEAKYKSGKFKVTVMRTSEEVIKKRYDAKDGHFICYKVTVYGGRKEPCDIVEENWNFRELSSLEQELM